MDKAGAFTLCSSAKSHGRGDSPERTAANFVDCLDTNSGKRNTKKWRLSIKNGSSSKPDLDQSQQMGHYIGKAAIMSLHPLCQWPSVAWLIKRTRKIISTLLTNTPSTPGYYSYLYKVLGWRSVMSYSWITEVSSSELVTTSKLIFLQPATSILYDVITAPLFPGCLQHRRTWEEDCCTCNMKIWS